VSGAGVFLFFLFGGLALISALGTILFPSPIRAAMALLAHIVSLSGLFLLLHAHLLAALQVLVYAGAVVVLFIFVIMLIGPTSSPPHGDRGTLIKACSGATMIVVSVLLAGSLWPVTAPIQSLDNCTALEGAECDQFGGVLAFSKSLFVGAVVPFELIAVLLTVAIVGAVAVARGRTKAESQAMAAKLHEKDMESFADEARERVLATRLTAPPPPERGV
jgi:NADH-quinone oxidoreductase subunit J